MSRIHHPDAYENAIKRRIIENAQTTFFRTYEDGNAVVEWLIDNDKKGNEFAGSLLQSFNSYGKLSPKQVEAVRKCLQREAGWAAERAAKRAEEAANAPDVIEGRIVITGEVLSLKETWTQVAYGTTVYALKALIKDDRGFKVYGSVPAALQNEVEKGTRITLTATVERSKDDRSFGFYKRPAKAEILKGEE